MRTKREVARAHYHAALANLNQRRVDYYEQIRLEYAGGETSLRRLEKEEGLSFQRIFQIVNGK